jgi:hypothetical protein
MKWRVTKTLPTETERVLTGLGLSQPIVSKLSKHSNYIRDIRDLTIAKIERLTGVSQYGAIAIKNRLRFHFATKYVLKELSKYRDKQVILEKPLMNWVCERNSKWYSHEQQSKFGFDLAMRIYQKDSPLDWVEITEGTEGEWYPKYWRSQYLIWRSKNYQPAAA